MPERCPECNLLGGHLEECSRAPAAPKYTPPNDLRSAAYVIAAVAFFYSAGFGPVLWMHWGDRTPIDTLGRIFVAFFVALIVLS
jgi:hypothetical protein